MQLKRIPVGALQANCYLVIKNNDCLIIDPGDEENKIIKEINNLNPLAIIITHCHFDHIGALEAIKNKYNIEVYDIKNIGKNKIGDFEFEIISTKGHSDTSITIYFEKEKIMFTGDFIFKNAIGRTDLDDSNPNLMIESIKKIRKYPNCKIYPGHGLDTTLNTEVKYFD